MIGTRKRYPAAFKARVALEAAKQTRTLAELSKVFQAYPVQITQWKKQLLDGAESLFGDGRRREHDQSEALQAEVYQQIGRLNMELEWLKKLAGVCPRVPRRIVVPSAPRLRSRLGRGPPSNPAGTWLEW
jgi:transposase-like protein